MDHKNLTVAALTHIVPAAWSILPATSSIEQADAARGEVLDGRLWLVRHGVGWRGGFEVDDKKQTTKLHETWQEAAEELADLAYDWWASIGAIGLCDARDCARLAEDADADEQFSTYYGIWMDAILTEKALTDDQVSALIHTGAALANGAPSYAVLVARKCVA